MTTPRFQTMQSAGLEELLRRPDLPAADRQAIQQELGRRIAGNLSGGPAPAPPSPPVGTPMPQRAVPASAGPPPPAPPPRVAAPPVSHLPAGPPPQRSRPSTPPRRSGSTAVGVFVAALFVVAAIVAGALYLTSGNDEPPPTQYGDTCYAADVYCPLAQEAPMGAPCQCFDTVGLAHTGTVG